MRDIRLNHSSRPIPLASSCWSVLAAPQTMSSNSSHIPVADDGDDDYSYDSDDDTLITLASTVRAYRYQHNRRYHEGRTGSQFLLLGELAASNAYHLNQPIHTPMTREVPTMKRSYTSCSLNYSMTNLTLHQLKRPATL